MNMNDREKTLENKYAHDQHKLFKIEARASKLVGLWAAEKLGLSGAEADTYAKSVIAANLDEPGYDDVKRKIMSDFEDKSIDISAHTIEVIIQKKAEEAAIQIENDAVKRA